MKQILMIGFSGILDTGQVEEQKMMKDELMELIVSSLEVNQLR